MASRLLHAICVRTQRIPLPPVGTVIVCALLGLAGCNRLSQRNPEALFHEARATFERGELPQAFLLADQGWTKFQYSNPDSAWRFRVLKAETLIWQGKSKESIALLEENLPVSLASDEISIRLKITQGAANYYLQRFNEAESRLSEAQQLATARHPDLLADVNLAQGALSILRNDLPAGERHLLRSLAIARDRNKQFVQANALGSLGVIALRRQHYDQAIDWLTQSRNISEKLGNKTQTSKTLGNLGWCYFKMGDTEKALSLFTESESLAAQLGLLKDQLLWLTNIGSIHYEQREYAEAANYYRRALEIARKLENKSAASIALSNLAATAIETRDFDRAEQYNREAFEMKRAIGDATSALYSSQNAARIAAGRNDRAGAIRMLQRVVHEAGENVSLRWEAQAELGNLYAAQRNTARADAQFRTALRTIDSARSGIKKEEQRLSFLGSAKRFYNDYIDFLIANHRTEEALRVAEHSRARTLAEGLGLDADPKATAFKPVLVAGKHKAVLLYYWLKPGQSYLWAVSPSRTELFRLPSDTDIITKLQDYRNVLMGPRDVREAANTTGQELYNVLVAPAQKLLAPGSRVIVLADGPLHALNFETLLVPGQQLHYWIEDAVITNGSSIALLAAPARKHPSRAKNLLLIGDPKYTESEFPPLPQAAQELKRVEEHFAPELRLVLAAGEAKPRAYAASNAGAYSYIHFVAHATASRTSPLDSSIILSKDGDNSKLYARDIMQQPLSADLVTISACHGAGTRAYSGEGLVGLSWAFLRAGAHHVIAALWEVNDASTPQLMDGLYSEMGKGKDPATALRSAKLAMLHSNSVYRRPFYWAPFQLYSGS
ncbi:MAG TPA: CHAT domain-containing protein [Clostridia bacterium]|nr:CHAT domain-containing protein [Clostridia bacterium]